MTNSRCLSTSTALKHGEASDVGGVDFCFLVPSKKLYTFVFRRASLTFQSRSDVRFLLLHRLKTELELYHPNESQSNTLAASGLEADDVIVRTCSRRIRKQKKVAEKRDFFFAN